MKSSEIHLGMDDIDSPRGQCTTHFASLVVESLSKWRVNWLDYPNLIRLNPNIPFRTRGNGAVALRFNIDSSKIVNLLPCIEDMIQDYVEQDYPNTNPGVVMVEGDMPIAVQRFSMQALWRAVPIAAAKRVIEKNGIRHITKGNGRGLVGALSAAGNRLEQDHTYEFIAYRSSKVSTHPRGVHEESVREMEEEMGEMLFSSLDPKTGRALIAPHGPDPVLYGVRGESAEGVTAASKFIRSDQSIDRWMVFRTNQGTGAHLKNCVYVADLRPYMAAVVHGAIDRKPSLIEGGHAIFGIGDCSGRIDCAAYEPTGEFRKIITSLEKGDQVMVHAAVRPASKSHGLTLNIEGMDIIKLVQRTTTLNPTCPRCSKRLKSAGTDKGYKCTNCGYKDPKGVKSEIPLGTELNETLYLPPPRSQRHLTRPFKRMNIKNSGIPDHLIENWHFP